MPSLLGEDPRVIPNKRNTQVPTPQGLLDASALLTAPVPVAGDLMGLLADANMIRNEPSWGNIGLAAAGIIPGVPAASVIKKFPTAKRAKDIEHEWMQSIDAQKVAGDRLAAANEQLRFIEYVDSLPRQKRLEAEMDVRRRIKELEESFKTNPTAGEPLRQANLMLEAIRGGNRTALEAESMSARKFFDEAYENSQRLNKLRNELMK